MTDKELIKEEIERRYNCEICYPNDREANVAAAVLQELLLFIDSLPEENHFEDKSEMVSEDLEEAAYHFCLDEYGNPKESLFEFDQRCFIAGAEWQKQKDQETIELAEDHAMLAGMNKMKEEMMKDAVDGEYWDGSIYLDNRPTEYKDGDKVKIIIIKPEQQ